MGQALATLFKAEMTRSVGQSLRTNFTASLAELDLKAEFQRAMDVTARLRFASFQPNLQIISYAEIQKHFVSSDNVK